MNDLRDLSVTQATHSELVEATEFYSNTLETHFAEHVFILAIVAKIKPLVEALKQALLALRSSLLVEELRKLDKIRDDAFIMFRDYVGLFARSTEAAKKAAYDRIYPLIEKAGISLWALGDAEETGQMQSLFFELDKAERQADLQELDALVFYSKVKAAEADFETLAADKLDEKARKKLPTIKTSRAALEPRIRDLFPALRMVAFTDETMTDFSWIDTLNEKTDMVMAQVAARRTRNDNEEEE